MSVFELRLETLAGTGIEDAVQKAKAKCISLNLTYTYLSFNGTLVSVGKLADPSKAVQQYIDACDNGVTYFIVENI